MENFERGEERWPSVSSPGNSTPPETPPEIETVHVGSAKSNIPFIPYSRISSDFRNYLEAAKMNAYPSIFPEKNWNDESVLFTHIGRFIFKKRKEKPTITAITPTDISSIWKEVGFLVQKYQYKGIKEWMTIYWFLSSCLMRAKIDSLKTDAACVTPSPKVAPIVADAKRMLTFQEFIMTEMMYRYEEMTHQRTQGSKLQQRKTGQERRGN